MLGIFFCASMFSGLAGGLVSYVITAWMHLKAGLEGWRWIFILEGIATVIFGFVCSWALPDYPATCTFLGDSEKIAIQSSLGGAHKSANTLKIMQSQQKVTISRMGPRMQILCKPSTYLFCIIFFMMLTTVYSFAFAFPSILLRMGYSSLSAQLLSSPPYLLALVSILVAGKIVDKYDARFPVLIVNFILGSIGFTGMIVFENMNIKYAFSFLACVGCNAAVSPFLSWLSYTAKGSSTAAGFLIGLVISIGNLGGVLTGFLYPSDVFYIGNGVNACFGVLALGGCIALKWLICRGL